MNLQFEQDRAKRPDLFYFLGAIPAEELDAWLRHKGFVVPEDLKKFWCQTGGGELFETETMLSPFGRTDLADDIESVNLFHRQSGMPVDWLVFHTGIGGLSVVKMLAGQYASVQEGSYQVQQTFSSLADWYAGLLRREYAARYGLQE